MTRVEDAHPAGRGPRGAVAVGGTGAREEPVHGRAVAQRGRRRRAPGDGALRPRDPGPVARPHGRARSPAAAARARLAHPGAHRHGPHGSVRPRARPRPRGRRLPRQALRDRRAGGAHPGAPAALAVGRRDPPRLRRPRPRPGQPRVRARGQAAQPHAARARGAGVAAAARGQGGGQGPAAPAPVLPSKARRRPMRSRSTSIACAASSRAPRVRIVTLRGLGYLLEEAKP